jgi:hypothetical protein
VKIIRSLAGVTEITCDYQYNFTENRDPFGMPALYSLKKKLTLHHHITVHKMKHNTPFGLLLGRGTLFSPGGEGWQHVDFFMRNVLLHTCGHGSRFQNQ